MVHSDKTGSLATQTHFSLPLSVIVSIITSCNYANYKQI